MAWRDGAWPALVDLTESAGLPGLLCQPLAHVLRRDTELLGEDLGRGSGRRDPITVRGPNCRSNTARRPPMVVDLPVPADPSGMRRRA
jgi:hypothetical protein